MKKPEPTNSAEQALKDIHDRYIKNVEELKELYDKHSLQLINYGIRFGTPIRPAMVEYYKDLRVEEF